VVAILGVLALTEAATAQVPTTIHHQGLLLDEQGAPADRQVILTFELFDQDVGGGALWAEEYQLDLVDGYYSTLLGSLHALDPWLGPGPRWLQITLNHDTVLAPRRPLASVPFARIAHRALQADNATGDITPNSVTVNGTPVIAADGTWVGPGAPGEGEGEGEGYSTPAEVLAALLTVDGPGTGLDADTLDGQHAAAFAPNNAAAIMTMVLSEDGSSSTLDADRLDGFDSTEFLRPAAPMADVTVRDLLLGADGQGSGVDADRLDNLDSSQFLRSDGDIVIGHDVEIQGALTVGGGIAGGTITAAPEPPGDCVEATWGLIYYDNDDHAFFGCTRDGWTELSGGGQQAEVPVISMAERMPDTRQTPGSFVDLVGRELTFDVNDATAVLKVSYQDVLGYHMVGHGHACAWRLTLDNAPVDRPFHGHTSTAPGWRIWPTRLAWYLNNPGVGRHVLRVQVHRVSSGTVSECLAGWEDNDTGNFLAVEEVPASRVAITRHMGDHRTTPGGWTDLPERTVSYTKQEAATLLRVAYTDVLGYNMTSVQSWGCRWQLTMDGAPVDRSFSSHTSTASGWRIHPTSLTWVLDDVPAGAHTFGIQVIRPHAPSCSECLAGWPNGDVGNSFVIQEVSGVGVALRRHMGDHRTTPGSWSPLPERELTHTKQGAASLVRVTYADVMGIHAVGHGWGCRWRVAVDGAPMTRPFQSHTSTRGGWRIHPTHMEWLIPFVGVGAHTYRIELIRPDGGTTSECLAGWPGNDVGNLLMVEEL